MQMRTPAPEKGTPRGHRGQEGNKTRSALRILNVLRYALVIAFAIDEIVLGVVLFVQRFLCLHVCESAEAHALSGKASLIHAQPSSEQLPALHYQNHCTALDVILQRKPALASLTSNDDCSFKSWSAQKFGSAAQHNGSRTSRTRAARRHTPAGARARMHTQVRSRITAPRRRTSSGRPMRVCCLPQRSRVRQTIARQAQLRKHAQVASRGSKLLHTDLRLETWEHGGHGGRRLAEDEGSQGAGTPRELLASRIE